MEPMTITGTAGKPLRIESSFFLVSGWILAVTIVAGFGTNALLGRSSFSSPAVYHVHALAFFGWVAIHLAQTGLASTGRLSLHRRLGWLATAWLPFMVTMGMWLNIHALRARGGSPPRPPSDFLFGNAAVLAAFTGLVVGGVLLRRRTDWHRRFMLCALALLASSAIGRLLPPTFNAATNGWGIIAILLIIPIAGVLAEAWRARRFHPAWALGIAVIIGSKLIGGLLAFSPWGQAVTEFVLAGSPDAQTTTSP